MTDNLRQVRREMRQLLDKVDNKVTMNKRIYGGAPCVTDTRVPVYAILEMVEAGYSHKRILKAFPTINKEGLEAALRFAVLVMEQGDSPHDLECCVCGVTLNNQCLDPNCGEEEDHPADEVCEECQRNVAQSGLLSE